MGLTARNYPIAAATEVSLGQVVKLSGAVVVTAAANETGAVLGIAGENHPGAADALNPRANGDRILVYDNPELIFECPVPVVTASGGSATTLVPASGEVAAAIADDAFNGGVLVLRSKAAASTNTDPVGKRITVSDYAKSGTVITKPSGGVPSAGDVYELYPPVGSAVGGLDSGRGKLVLSAAGAASVKVVGHDYDRSMIRCMAVKHVLGGTN